MASHRWTSDEVAAGAELIAGALFISADLTTWGTWAIPILRRPVAEGVAIPGLPLLAAALAFGGAVSYVAQGSRRIALVLMFGSLAAMLVATVRTVLRLHDAFQGVDSTNWARYTIPGYPGPAHSYAYGLLAAILGVLLLLTAGLLITRRRAAPNPSPS